MKNSTGNITSMEKKDSYVDEDATASSRKEDHIDLAFKSQQNRARIDGRFFYEPILSGHKTDSSSLETSFGKFTLKTPMWVSSMTGGTEKARDINFNLAKACGRFGMGMGLGSCRSLLFSDEYLTDFQVKRFMPDMPLYANLGIAQLEQLVALRDWERIRSLLDKLDADGLIIHVNPLQEWLQPEGDRFERPPIETIQEIIEHIDTSIIVKEVGQGMGPKSLDALLRLPITAIEFAASGGTNFATLELLRADEQKQALYSGAANIGHTAEEMTLMVNKLWAENQADYPAKSLIISGGVRDYLDGFYLRELSKMPAISGHASSFLKYALQGEEALNSFMELQQKGLLMAESFLEIKHPNL